MQELEAKKQENILLKAQLQQAYNQFEGYKVKAAADTDRAVRDAREKAAAETRSAAGAMVSQSSFGKACTNPSWCDPGRDDVGDGYTQMP